MKIPRVAAVHDLSGFGRCSLSVVIPVLSAMGVQCCPIPTAVLSAHTGFTNPTFCDLTDEMIPIADHWNRMNIKFNGFYSGFLGSLRQIEIVQKLISTFGNDNNIVLVDPVMGDDGKPYSTYSKEMCDRMKELVCKADIITPNLTETVILLDKPFSSMPSTEKDFKECLVKLCNLGPKIAIITGVSLASGEIGAMYYNKTSNRFGYYATEYIGASYPGTGDIFASVLLGALMNGESLDNSICMAADFVHDCMTITLEAGNPVNEGVLFELKLKELCND